MRETCSHLHQIQRPSPDTDGCEEWLRRGDSWGRLRRFVEEQACEEACDESF